MLASPPSYAMPYTLGIDLGTSKVAVVAADAETGAPAATAACPTNADIPCPAPRAEQEPGRILNAVDSCIQEIPEGTREQVVAIGTAGQMHGVMLCSADYRDTSSLVTWQDGRCGEDGFLDRLAEKTGSATLRTGYGCATLAWFAENEPDLLQHFDRATTIPDYFVAGIVRNNRNITDPTNAAAWGLYDLDASAWSGGQIDAAGIPARLLPGIQPSGSVAGELNEEHAARWGIPPGIPITLPIGDNQASLLATLRDPVHEVALTLGTGGQLSVVVDDIEDVPAADTIEVRPYLNGKTIAVAAALCGGLAVTWLVDSLLRWCKAMGVEPPERDSLFKHIDRLALENAGSPLQVCPSFLGERTDPTRRGAMAGIDLENFTLGNLSAALVRGVVQNLHDMMPRELLQNRSRVIGSGNGLRLMAMQAAVEEVFGLPMELTEEREEAALGAARLAAGKETEHV